MVNGDLIDEERRTHRQPLLLDAELGRRHAADQQLVSTCLGARPSTMRTC